MNKKTLAKLMVELESLRMRKGNITSREIVRFANKCGRKSRSGGKGKEPTYLSDILTNHKPLSIPYHSGNMRVGTVGNILDILEQDIFDIEEMLESQTRGKNG